jgi:alpha-mannosidase
MPASQVLHIVPHTHWDREWYEPFEGYRFRLVKMVDRLLWVLENDPGFRHFHFDGQTAAIEDYLAVRPEAEERVSALVREGRLGVGPWRILMDEFLCSPETLVRNLQQGRRTASRLGAIVELGYIPDSFGHVAQMPQILRSAGITDAFVWRGVPAKVDRSVFQWEAPDGSRVRTGYMATSYSNGASLPPSYEDLIRRVKRIFSELDPFAPGRVVLAMNGTDHYGPAEELPGIVAEANELQDEIGFRIGSLLEYANEMPDGDGAPVWRGEMRSGARANLLMGVASARVPLKQAEYRASALLERYAEPLSALAGTEPGTLLDRAWTQIVENSAHDSICGCGVDAVAADVAARYQNAAAVAELVAADALSALAGRIDVGSISDTGAFVFNPSPFARGGLAEVALPVSGAIERLTFRSVDGALHPAQLLSSEEQVIVDMTLRGSQLARIVPTVHSRMMGHLYVNDVRVEEGDPATVRIRLGERPEGDLDVEGVKARVEDAIEASPRARFYVRAAGAPMCRVLTRVPDIGGLGWTVLSVEDGAATVESPANAEGSTLENEHLRASVRLDGTVSLTHRQSGVTFEGLFGLEDGGDIGDEYNWCPPDRDRVVRTPAGPATIEVTEPGPLQATIRVFTHWRLPAHQAAAGRGRSRRTVTMPVITELSLRAGEPFLRATIRVENTARDHRLRAVFPLPFSVAGSSADTAFHVTDRSLVAEGGPHELGMPTYPCRRWVDASDGAMGLAVMHRGTPEYEVGGGKAVAVTLLRCVGWLARQGFPTRAAPAGPALSTPEAQLPGAHRFSLAVYPHAGDWRTGRVHEAAEAFAYPFRSATLHPHGGDVPASASGLSIAPGNVQLSALTRDGEGVVCRVYNASPDAVHAILRLGPTFPAARASRVDLHGRPLQELELDGRSVALPLRQWEIATIRFA